MTGKTGPKPWSPSAADRTQIEAYVACGLTQEQISGLVGVSTDTLQRHCRLELDNGLVHANAKVAATLFQKAMAGDNSCMIFWLKTRAGWRDVSAVEVTGKDGAAIEVIDATAAAFDSRIAGLLARVAGAGDHAVADGSGQSEA